MDFDIVIIQILHYISEKKFKKWCGHISQPTDRCRKYQKHFTNWIIPIGHHERQTWIRKGSGNCPAAVSREKRKKAAMEVPPQSPDIN
jgi:hypothetical protein